MAVALAGSRFRLPTVLYVGWFGPRGLASIVFALLLLEDGPPAAGLLVDVVALTVGLSVVLHGATAAWAARTLRRMARGRGCGRSGPAGGAGGTGGRPAAHSPEVKANPRPPVTLAESSITRSAVMSEPSRAVVHLAAMLSRE